MALTKVLSRNRGFSSSCCSTGRAGRSALDVGGTEAVNAEKLIVSEVSMATDISIPLE
jgi:hypothetical protein